eukprot:scaffold264651_cov46-Prasinocladus_malaysianus.AAC.1
MPQRPVRAPSGRPGGNGHSDSDEIEILRRESPQGPRPSAADINLLDRVGATAAPVTQQRASGRRVLARVDFSKLEVSATPSA